MDPSFDLRIQERRLLGHISHFPKPAKEKIIKAYGLAKKHHSGQKRDEGGPYVLHCLRVANLLLESLGIKDADVISAALLHDAVEDTRLDLEEIKSRFGKKTAQLVNNLTRRKLPGETESNKYERKNQRFLGVMKKDSNTRAIKACDWLDNMMSWPRIPQNHPARKKFKRWFREAETMYIPLALSVDKRLADKMKVALGEAKSKFKQELN